MRNIIIVIIAFFISQCNNDSVDWMANYGNTLPEFNVLQKDGTIYKTKMDSSAKKPLVIIYYSSGCPFCRAQLKDIYDNSSSLKNIEFIMLTNKGYGNPIDFNREYSPESTLNVISGLDSSLSVIEYYGIKAVPFIAMYGSNKKLLKTHIGRISIDEIKKDVLR